MILIYYNVKAHHYFFSFLYEIFTAVIDIQKSIIAAFKNHNEGYYKRLGACICDFVEYIKINNRIFDRSIFPILEELYVDFVQTFLENHFVIIGKHIKRKIDFDIQNINISIVNNIQLYQYIKSFTKVMKKGLRIS